MDIVRVGASGEPVAVIDGAFADPGAIVAAIADHARFEAQPATVHGYPGVQAPAPRAYVEALLRAAGPALSAVFGTEEASIGEITCRFSLVTLPPGKLHPLQTVPHIDVADPQRFAVLHYLCDRRFGGTAFFRQRATSLEQIGKSDWSRSIAARDAALEAGAQAAYPNETTAGYVRTASIPCRMDRLLVYRSFTLHSGVIREGIEHPADPRRGRLTGNLFARYRTA